MYLYAMVDVEYNWSLLFRFACLSFVVCRLSFVVWGLAASRVWGLGFGVCLSFVVYRLLFGGFKLIQRFEPFEPFKQIFIHPIQPIQNLASSIQLNPALSSYLPPFPHLKTMIK